MKKILVVLILGQCFVGCVGSKKLSENASKTSQKERLETKTVLDSQTLTSEAIKDRIVVNVPESDNKEVTEMFERLMMSMNTSKTSGSNSYVLRYDDKLRQLIAEMSIAQTQNSRVVKDSIVESEKSFEEEVTEKSKKVLKVIPWWFWVALGVWFLPSIISRVSMIVNPVSALFLKNK